MTCFQLETKPIRKWKNKLTDGDRSLETYWVQYAVLISDVFSFFQSYSFPDFPGEKENLLSANEWTLQFVI